MKPAGLGLNMTTKREFLSEMEHVMPWAVLVALITPYAPEGKRGCPLFAHPITHKSALVIDI